MEMKAIERGHEGQEGVEGDTRGDQREVVLPDALRQARTDRSHPTWTRPGHGAHPTTGHRRHQQRKPVNGRSPVACRLLPRGWPDDRRPWTWLRGRGGLVGRSRAPAVDHRRDRPIRPRLQRVAYGASRATYLVEMEAGGDLVARVDTGDGPMAGTELSLVREAAVYRALAGTGVRIPRLHAVAPDGTVLLTDRAPGTTRSTSSPSAERHAVYDDYLDAIADLHDVDATALDLPATGAPRTALPTPGTSSTCGPASSSGAPAGPGRWPATRWPSSVSWRPRWSTAPCSATATSARATSCTRAGGSPHCSTGSSPIWVIRWTTWGGGSSAATTCGATAATSARSSPGGRRGPGSRWTSAGRVLPGGGHAALARLGRRGPGKRRHRDGPVGLLPSRARALGPAAPSAGRTARGRAAAAAGRAGRPAGTGRRRDRRHRPRHRARDRARRPRPRGARRIDASTFYLSHLAAMDRHGATWREAELDDLSEVLGGRPRSSDEGRRDLGAAGPSAAAHALTCWPSSGATAPARSRPGRWWRPGLHRADGARRRLRGDRR